MRETEPTSKSSNSPSKATSAITSYRRLASFYVCVVHIHSALSVVLKSESSSKLEHSTASLRLAREISLAALGERGVSGAGAPTLLVVWGAVRCLQGALQGSAQLQHKSATYSEAAQSHGLRQEKQGIRRVYLAAAWR